MPSRVAVLDLRARDDVFLGDGGLARVAARLEREGHEVVRVRATWDGEPTLELDGKSADVVVLGRAWDVTLLEVLRRTFGASKIVRLTNGVAAALDHRFDHVVDERGLFALLAGQAPPAPAAPPRTAREIRALRVLDHDEDGPETAGSLPAIRGPATGCPYLVDARGEARFARLDLGAEVQTKGCTFCLDNTGGYAAASADETVARWLSQLRTLRGEHGEGRLEVLLVDERPHPLLPRLFRELDSPIELLIKSRVDWLLEHEAELAEACTLAERTGSIVHVYLVGFESFDDDTLALFNKGTDAADNVRAIALLRAFAARFPRTFEYRRLRAHGFVAFTPWTTPESLLRNATAMREVGFSELRADAARTRLRLYPRTPLHALAKADGLLVERFDATRADRAAEQGYDASFAWRFADPRVEAIFRACDGLRAHARDLPDADVLELATRFVLRWPGLIAAPDVAHLPLLRALRDHAIGTRELPSTLRAAAIVDHELERLADGEKRALLKEGVPTPETEGLIRAYRAMGFFAAVVETHDVDETGGKHVHGRSHAIVAVAGNDADLELVTRLQRARDTRAMGALMGYPTCCVEAFLAQPDRRDNAENERWTLRRTDGAPLDPRLGRLGPVRLVSHHPCRADCAASIVIADATLARIGAASPDAERWVRETLQQPVLFLDHARSATLRGRFEGPRFVVQRFDSAWQAGDVDAIELAFDHVVLFGSERRIVRADRPLLVVPGEPVPAPTAHNLAPWLSLSPDLRCNHRCLGCDAVSEGGPALTARELVARLVEGRRQGIDRLEIGGGEPTLRRDLLPLVREAKSRGYARIRLLTNGAMLAYPELVRRLVDAGVTDVRFSIKGPDAATHDRLARSEGAFDLLVRGIENARAAGLRLEGELLVYRSTTARIPDVARTFSRLGIERLRLVALQPKADDPEAAAEAPVPSEIEAAVAAADRDAILLDLHPGEPRGRTSRRDPPSTA